MSVLPIIVFSLEAVPKDLKREVMDMGIKGKIETIQTTTSKKSVRILKRVTKM